VHLEASTKPHVHNLIHKVFINMAFTMVCPNFNKGLKMVSGPLGVKAPGDVSIKDALLPVERISRTIEAIIRDKLVHDMSPPSPSVLRRTTLPKVVEGNLFKPSVVRRTSLVNGRPQRGTKAAVQFDTTLLLVDRNSLVADGLEKPSNFLPGLGSIPHMLPLKFMGGRQNPTPLLLNQIGNDMAFLEELPSLHSAVVHEGDLTGPSQTARVPGELISFSIEKIDVVFFCFCPLDILST
jgi:hypothetical protein